MPGWSATPVGGTKARDQNWPELLKLMLTPLELPPALIVPSAGVRVNCCPWPM
jgi:hypothetical protein